MRPLDTQPTVIPAKAGIQRGGGHFKKSERLPQKADSPKHPSWLPRVYVNRLSSEYIYDFSALRPQIPLTNSRISLQFPY